MDRFTEIIKIIFGGTMPDVPERWREQVRKEIVNDE